jgi:RNA polymerase sigma-70 factor (ECF subfamily)
MKNNLNTTRNFVDLEMVERLHKVDSEVFAGLFHAHKARIYYICLRMTNNTVQAEDPTGDAFLHVFRKLSAFKGNSLTCPPETSPLEM